MVPIIYPIRAVVREPGDDDLVLHVVAWDRAHILVKDYEQGKT